MFESTVKTKKNGLLKLTGNLAGAILLFGAAIYFPVTFLIALYQYQNAQNWEVKKCETRCLSSQKQYRPRNSFRDKLIVWTTVFYDLKPKIERPAEIGANPFKTLKTTGQESKEWNEMQETAKGLDEQMNSYDAREPLSKRNYSIYHFGGWQYWGDFGLNDFCLTDSGQTRNDSAIFESDCYVNPADKNDIALYRDFNLGWFLPAALLISLAGLILLIYSVKHDYQKLSKGA